MPGGSCLDDAGPGPELDAPVLIAGDAEADLGVLAAALTVDGHPRPSIAAGIPAACAALRLTEFAVVVADVATSDEALTILRAAGRGRPAARVICLFPAHYTGHPELASYIEGAAFAVCRHPVSTTDLARVVQQARGGFVGERRAWHRVHTDRDRWAAAEARLGLALRRMLEEVGGRATPEGVEVTEVIEVIERAVASCARAARSGEDGPALLIALAEGLTPRSGGVRRDHAA